MRYAAAVLLEARDPSHGHITTDNLPYWILQHLLIQLHEHPAQSPDLNAIQGG